MRAPRFSENRTGLTALLACGIAAPLLYVAMLVLVPMGWEGYSSASQTVSELSAIGAPTRALWVALGIVYTLLLVAFGWGIWASARGSRALRVVGVLMIGTAVLGLFWPPMHLREVLAAGGRTLTDTLHIVWMIASGLLTLVAMAFSAAAFGKRFRIYSIATIVLMVSFGALTSVAAPQMEANLPTPWIGVWERLNIAVWMLWIAVLAIASLRRQVVRRLP
ncbi:MAG TPA: DUF998 domain-containing protein [Gemmatimonadales bacterium]